MMPRFLFDRNGRRVGRQRLSRVREGAEGGKDDQSGEEAVQWAMP
jgi:hypothetical protein